MSEINDGRPAFPAPDFVIPADLAAKHVFRLSTMQGMTLRQYAAIKLRVPNSGTDWLDDMIRKAQRDYFAAKAMQALINPIGEAFDRLTEVPEYAYQIADAMLRAREGE